MSEDFSGLRKSRKSISTSAFRKYNKINDIEHKNIKKALKFMQQGNYKDAEIIYKKFIKEKNKNHTVFGNLAVIYYKKGKIKEMIMLLKEALKLNPDYPEGLLNMGAALVNLGKLQEGIAYYKKALSINPNFPGALTNLGATLVDLGKPQEGIAYHKKALAIDPNFPVALTNLGAALVNLGKPQEGIAYYKKALSIDSNFPGALTNLGAALVDLGKPQEGIAYHKKALAIDPNFPVALTNLGAALVNLGKSQEGIAYYKKALAIDPNSPTSLTGLGAALVDLGKPQEGIAYHKKALAIGSNSPAVLANLGAALMDLGKPQESINYYKKVLAIDPDSSAALTNLGAALEMSGELQEASNIYRKAISLRPDYLTAHYNLSCSLLRSGDYENGWKEYEWRFHVENKLHVHLPQLKKWDGSSYCSGDKLVLISEQGLGDIMQFMRYIPYLRKRGMIVAFCTQTKLHGLIQTSRITSEIYSPEEAYQLTTGEWLPLLSLPMHLKVRPDNPLVQEPYIKAPAERTLYWRQKLSSEKRPIIGINWQGNARAERHALRGRSLPLEAFTSLTENIDASFLSLQKGGGSEQLTDCKFLDRFVGCQEEINQTWDFVENAAIIMNCDLIITIDTVVAHLAGGLGKTTWLLLHKTSSWRWGMEGDTTFWYPSMRLFRQQERCNWQEVMDRVATALQGAYSQQFIQGTTGSGIMSEGCSGLAKSRKSISASASRKHGRINDTEHGSIKKALKLMQQGNHKYAEAIYKKLIKGKTRNYAVFENLAVIYYKEEKIEEMIMLLKEALKLNPDYPEGLLNMGAALVDLGKSQEGIAYCKKALSIEPNSPGALTNLGAALEMSGELQEARNTYRKAISLKSDYTPAHYNLSCSLLKSGDYENGWKEYEWRFRVKDRLHAHFPQLKKWDGSSHCFGEKLVLVSEQGLGDIMQFMRYIPYLCKRGMVVAFCTQTKLHGLIQASDITSEIYSPEEAHQLTTGEWLPLLSLPMHLKVRPDNPLVQEPYIKAPAERTLYWRQKLSSEKRPIIGINWQGNARAKRHALRGRSLPLEAFTSLTENIDASFLSLQKGDGSEQLTDCKFLDRFVGCQEEINQTWDFVENAAIIMNCDLIITIDTVVAHLAGGLGKATWLLLHKTSSWRWGMEGDTTFWYPSMRLFRQRERGNWQEVMDRVATALQRAYSQQFIQGVTGSGIISEDFSELGKSRKSISTSASRKRDRINNTEHENIKKALKSMQQGNYKDAEAIYKKLIKEKTKNYTIFGNLAVIYYMKGRIKEMIILLKEALKLNPDYSEGLLNMGAALMLSGKLQEASNTYRKIISLRSDYTSAHWNLSYSLLSSGDYENGWKEYEWRFRIFRVEDTLLHAHLPQLKKWDGSSYCSGDRLVLVSEQGLGDTMQFMRYIPYLRKRKMIVAFCTKTKLHGLIQASGITSEIYSPEEVHQLTTGEWLPLLSLPMHLKVRPDNPLVQGPYIKAPAERTLYWRQKLSSEKRPIIGINWQGKARAEIPLRRRSLPLEAFTSLTENIDASFLSLQKGSGSEQLTDCKFLDRFVSCQEEINQIWDFVENAAIIMNCDLIITIDTVVAHLAGGLGQPIWLLLLKTPDWRWGMEGDTTFWYPSMRLFRQRQHGHWQEVMDRVATALQGAYG